MHIPTDTEMQLPSGGYLDILDPDPSCITVEDIATMLSKEPRYRGATLGFLSVAEHAVLVATKLRQIGAPLQLQFAGLHHDDSEIVTGDWLRPLKMALPYAALRALRELTERMDEAIWQALSRDGALWPRECLHDPELKRVDTWAVALESRAQMPTSGQGWWQRDLLVQMPSHPEDRVFGLSWGAARESYLDLHYTLLGEAVGAPSGVRA